MPDPTARLNAALEGRYTIEREKQLSVKDTLDVVLVTDWFEELQARMRP